MALAKYIAYGIIITPPFTNKENKDSLPAEEAEAIPVLSICKKKVNMYAGVYL